MTQYETNWGLVIMFVALFLVLGMIAVSGMGSDDDKQSTTTIKITKCIIANGTEKCTTTYENKPKE